MGRSSVTLPPPPNEFFLELERVPARVLMLDYDGTLAPFRVERSEARPYPGVRCALADILRSGRTRLVIVSGRAMDDLAILLGIEPLPEVWASHGWERRTAEGTYRLSQLPEAAKTGLALAADEARDAGLGPRTETKPAGLALHWRGMAPREVDSLKAWGEAHWGPLSERHGLELHDFDGGLELRPPGVDKGTAVRAVVAESRAGALTAYLGDDLTDEDAFKALPAGGLGVLVRGEPRPTAASAWIRHPEELVAFLARWGAVAGGSEHVDTA